VVLLSHTYRSLLVPFDTPVGGRKVFCLLVLRTCDILVGIRIRGSVPLNYGSGFGSEFVYFILLCMVEGRDGKEQCSFRTRTGARFAWLLRGGKEQCSVLFAHISDLVEQQWSDKVVKN
jgi:hypothetical protein